MYLIGDTFNIDMLPCSAKMIMKKVSLRNMRNTCFYNRDVYSIIDHSPNLINEVLGTDYPQNKENYTLEPNDILFLAQHNRTEITWWRVFVSEYI